MDHLDFSFQVLAAKPGDQGFSPLWKLNLVEWNQNVNPRELKPAQEIMGAQQNGSLTVKKTDVVVNHPVIKWDGGSLKIGVFDYGLSQSTVELSCDLLISHTWYIDTLQCM